MCLFKLQSSVQYELRIQVPDIIQVPSSNCLFMGLTVAFSLHCHCTYGHHIAVIFVGSLFYHILCVYLLWFHSIVITALWPIVIFPHFGGFVWCLLCMEMHAPAISRWIQWCIHELVSALDLKTWSNPNRRGKKCSYIGGRLWYIKSNNYHV
jgi:hypothetical protein